MPRNYLTFERQILKLDYTGVLMGSRVIASPVFRGPAHANCPQNDVGNYSSSYSRVIASLFRRGYPTFILGYCTHKVGNAENGWYSMVWYGIA